jgi:signal transduction histidine kinase
MTAAPVAEDTETIPVVFVVDDDPGMRQTLVEILNMAGIPAEGFETGASALEAAEGRHRPALALLDHRLPDTTGIEVATAMRSKDPDLAVVLLTGYASTESAIAAIGVVDDYLLKPVPPDELVRFVTAGLERTRLRRENRHLVDRLHEMNSSLEETVAELDRQADELRRSNAELEQFAYIASHDLSEPLRTIAGYVGLIARRYRGQIDEDADRFIKHTEDGCKRMRALIDDLLSYSQAGRSGDLSALVDPTEIVRGVLTSLSAAVAEGAASVELDRLPTVQADPGQLAQLFQNLIANSLKFTTPGITPSIRITAEQHDGDWVFVVADNGIGIDPEYRERIFRMFQRLHPREAYDGTGIGLAICLRIVQAHGGRIWVEDQRGGGSRFCFTLPLQS